MRSYNIESGYIPSKIYNLLEKDNTGPPVSVTLNGCGGPYDESRNSLPVRIWSIEQVQSPDITVQDYSECTLPPSFLKDHLSGLSVEIIAIAGIAKMLNVTLHLIHKGDLGSVKEYWDKDHSMGYSQSDIAYPLINSRWNNTPQSTAGSYCIRWNKDDDETIIEFLKQHNSVALVGHSRGDVAFLIASNYLAEWFNTLSIKIIALDPVPGSGDWWDCLTTIPATPNMEYVGIYNIDETSACFNGVVPKVAAIDQTTKVHPWVYICYKLSY